MAKEKTFVEDVQRDLYDFRDEEIDFYRVDTGLTKDIVLQISEEKNDPEWMRDFRLKCLDIFNHSKMPPWGPSIDGLNLDNIVTYVKPKTGMAGKWEDVPEDIKNTFERLGKQQFAFHKMNSLFGIQSQKSKHQYKHKAKYKLIFYD